MRRPRKVLEAAYRSYEATLPIAPVDGGGPIDPGLVTFKDSRHSDDAHSWFHFKEGFSGRLLLALLRELEVPSGDIVRVLDPFAGVGTTLLSAQLARTNGWRLDAVGVERNPFLRFAAEAKLDWPSYDAERVRSLVRDVLCGGADAYMGALPDYSTLRNPKAYHPLRLRCLLGYRDKIKRVARDTPEEKLLLLGLAAALEGLSGMRKDGRALRFVSRMHGQTPREALRDRWNHMLRTLELMHSENAVVNPARVVGGDARDLRAAGVGGSEEFDLIIYSPPYLNNIDYTEVYKIELWMLGIVESQQEFRELSESTLRSHPRAKLSDSQRLNLPTELPPVVRDVIAALPEDGRAWRSELFTAYAEDMLVALESQFLALKPGGRCVCVVGNSLHGGRAGNVPVATDLMIVGAAQSLGYLVNRIYVVRHLRRRDRESSPFLRESIIVMEKPS